MDEYSVTVIGDPVPWAKSPPRGKGPPVPPRQARQAARIAQAYVDAGGPKFPKGVAVEVDAVFYRERPDAHYGTGRNADVLKDRHRGDRPTGRPDLSNCLKLIEDALTHFAWADDDQVVSYGCVEKRYVDSRDEAPRTIVTVRAAHTAEVTSALTLSLAAA